MNRLVTTFFLIQLGTTVGADFGRESRHSTGAGGEKLREGTLGGTKGVVPGRLSQL